MLKNIFVLFFIIQSYGLFSQINNNEIGLFPQKNNNRNKENLSGIWQIKVDSLGIGEFNNWQNGLENTIPIAVPGSWNEQYDFLRDYLGMVWYQTDFYVNDDIVNNNIFIRFGSANYYCKVWLNGHYLGFHEGGNLPFVFKLNNYLLKNKKNVLVTMVENEQKPTRVPVGGLNNNSFFSNNLKTSYDFFPFSGLQRDVWLYSTPLNYIKDIKIETNINNDTGQVLLNILSSHFKNNFLKISIFYKDSLILKNVFECKNFSNVITSNIPKAMLWNPKTPHLYKLHVELFNQNNIIDEYSLHFGVRTIQIKDNKILLNNQEITLKGFGKHEDFSIFGRGTALPVMIKDFSLLKWIGVNSIRTAHYPHDEEFYNLADKEGIMIIDEIPAVGLFFSDKIENIKTRERICLQQIEEMIARDKNHPSVIMWSLANEPISQTKYEAPTNMKDIDSTAWNFFASLFKKCNELDKTRLKTIINLSNFMPANLDSNYNFADVIAVNLYFGWYSQFGDLITAKKQLKDYVINLYKKTKKPIFISEFGADTYNGMNQLNPEMFSEEYQTEILKLNLEIANELSFIVGMHVWTYADFKTAQGLLRFGGLNLKGVFTRDRKPKMGAYFLKSKWDKK